MSALSNVTRDRGKKMFCRGFIRFSWSLFPLYHAILTLSVVTGKVSITGVQTEKPAITIVWSFDHFPRFDRYNSEFYQKIEYARFGSVILLSCVLYFKSRAVYLPSRTFIPNFQCKFRLQFRTNF